MNPCSDTHTKDQLKILRLLSAEYPSIALAGATLVCVDVPLNLATIVLAPPMIAGAIIYSVSSDAVRQKAND